MREDRLPLLAVMALVLAGCSAGESAAPPETPDIAGAYEGQFTVTASSSAANQNLGTFPATATISQQKSNVSIVVVPPQGGTFSFSGSVLPGGAVTLRDDAGLSFLTVALPQCSFADASVTSEAFPADDRLILTADIVGAACPWVESNGAVLATTFAMRFEGT